MKEAALSAQRKLAARPAVSAFDLKEAYRPPSVTIACEPTPHPFRSPVAPVNIPLTMHDVREEADTSGTTTDTSSPEQPPPGQRARSSSGAAEGGLDKTRGKGDEDELSSLEVIPGTLSDAEDESRRVGEPNFHALAQEVSADVGDEREVARFADETDRDVRT